MIDLVEFKPLSGHVSPETAFMVNDYPYGYHYRCEIRYWIETKKGFGQRVVSQTTNPKKFGHPWNKPNPGTYSTVRVLYIDPATGYCENTGLYAYASLEQIEEFEKKFGGVLDEYQKNAVNKIRVEAQYRHDHPIKLVEYGPR